MCIHEIFANKFQGDSGSQAGMTEGLEDDGTEHHRPVRRG